MKKILHNLSLMTCLSCVFCLIVFAAPGVVGYDDSSGFAIIYLSIILPFISSLLWTVFSIRNNENYSKLKKFAVSSLIINAILLLNIFLDFLPIGEAGLWLQIIFGIVTGILFITYSNN